MISASYNDSGLNELIGRLQDAFVARGRNSEPAVIIKDESRLFLKQAIRLTPPKKKEQGEQAIKTDLLKLFSPVTQGDAEYIARNFGTSNVNHWLTNKQGEHYQVKFARVDVQGYGMDAFHQENRKSRGRVGRNRKAMKKVGGLWQTDYLVSHEAFESYYDRTRARVGQQKSGFLAGYLKVDGKLPRWIARHASKHLGAVIDQLDAPGAPSMTFSNHANGVTAEGRIFTDTLRARKQAIAKRIRLVLANYGEDVKRSIKSTRTKSVMETSPNLE